MKELISIFQKNKTSILEQLLEIFQNKNLDSIKSENLDEAFLYFNALETIYAVDKDYLQLSPIFNRNTQNYLLLD